MSNASINTVLLQSQLFCVIISDEGKKVARKKRGLFRRLKRIKQKQIEVMQSPEKAAKYKSFGIKSIICSLAAVICSAGLPFVSVRLLYLTMTADFLIVGNIFCAIASLICLFFPICLMALSATYCSAQRRTNKLQVGKTALTMTVLAILVGLALIVSMSCLAYSSQFV